MVSALQLLISHLLVGKWVLEHSSGSSDCTRQQQKPWVACLACFTYYAACIENTSTKVEECKYMALHMPSSRERGEMAGVDPEGCRGRSSPVPASCTSQGQVQARQTLSSLPQEGQVPTWQNQPRKNAALMWDLIRVQHCRSCHLPQVALGSERNPPNSAAHHQSKYNMDFKSMAGTK